MNHRVRRGELLVAVILTACLMPVPAAAQYFDPGAASIIVQAIVGAVVAVGVGLKLYWHKLAGFFSRRRPEDDREP